MNVANLVAEIASKPDGAAHDAIGSLIDRARKIVAMKP